MSPSWMARTKTFLFLSEVIKIQRFEPPTFGAGFLGTGDLEGTFALSRGAPNLPSYHRCPVGGLR